MYIKRSYIRFINIRFINYVCKTYNLHISLKIPYKLYTHLVLIKLQKNQFLIKYTEFRYRIYKNIYKLYHFHIYISYRVKSVRISTREYRLPITFTILKLVNWN